MKKFLLSLLTLAATSLIAGAQENLLAGAIGTTVNNKEAFYNVWQVYGKDGEPIQEGFRKYSCFAKAYDSDIPMADYNIYKGINIAGDHDAFRNGNYFILMNFPGENYSKAPHYYAYPINIKEEGDYLLTGCGQGNKRVWKPDNNKTEDQIEGNTAAEHAWLEKTKSIAITFDQTVTPKEFTVEEVNGKNEVVAYSKTETGKVKVPIHRFVVGNSSENPGGNFSHTVHLTPEHKYMTIQAPACLLALGNLSLTKDGEVSVNEFLTDDDAEPEFFDLQGRRAGTDASHLENGIYIKKTGAKTEKVAIR